MVVPSSILSLQTALPVAPSPHGFQPFSGVHLLAVVAFLQLCVMLVALARWLPERRVRFIWCGFVLAWQTIATTYYLWPTTFDITESLPIQVCDLAAWLAPFALLSNNRWLRSLLYFWAFGLCTQAFITPVLTRPPEHVRFWFFFVGHAQIIASAVYDVVIRGFVPSGRDLLRALAVMVVVGFVILGFNIAADVNYWYIGNSLADQTTIVDRLGPWPARIPIIVALATIAQTLAWLPWPIVRAIAAAGRDATNDRNADVS